MTPPERVIREAEDHLGCPYVYGTWGQLCTTALRKRYAGYNPSQREITYARCQRLRDKDRRSSCAGCPYDGKLAFDCSGFTHWCLKTGAGIEISGGYVGRQWSDPNWMVKGDVSDMIEAVACLFLTDMSHTGLYVLDGRVIHCSGEVKRDTMTGGRKWALFGIPKGLYTWAELAALVKGDFKRMLKKGMRGSDVRDLQIMLNALGYDCGVADGIFGNKTVTAVKAFQTAEGLTADGIAGQDTLERLAARAAAPDGPIAGELPEDDDEIDVSTTLVSMTYTDALQLRDALRNALVIINKALDNDAG